MARIGDLLVRLGLVTDGLDRGINKANRKFSRFDRDVSKYSKGITRSLGSLAGAFGATFAIGAVVNDSIRTISGFEQSVADLASISGKSARDLGPLIQSAKDIGAVSAFSASQVVGLQTELAKLGFDEREIIASTKAIGDFSIAVGTDAASAAKLAGSVLRGFGKDASEAESVVSSLAVATTKSALDFEKLNVGLSITAPVAKAANVGIERTTSLLGVLADRGLDASTAGSSLRNIFLDLADKGLTWDQAMEKIRTSTNKLATANELFGKRGATTALILADNETAANRLESSITNVDGALQEMTDTRLNTLQGQLTLTRSAWEGLILSIDSGDGVISRAVKGVVSTLGDFINDLQVLNDDGIAGLIAKGQENIRKDLEEQSKRNLRLVTGIQEGATRGLRFRTFGEQTELLEKTLSGLQNKLNSLKPDTDDYKQVVDDIAEVKSKLTERTKEFNGVITTTGTVTGYAKKELQGFQKFLSDTGDSLLNFTEQRDSVKLFGTAVKLALTGLPVDPFERYVKPLKEIERTRKIDIDFSDTNKVSETISRLTESQRITFTSNLSEVLDIPNNVSLTLDTNIAEVNENIPRSAIVPINFEGEFPKIPTESNYYFNTNLNEIKSDLEGLDTTRSLIYEVESNITKVIDYVSDLPKNVISNYLINEPDIDPVLDELDKFPDSILLQVGVKLADTALSDYSKIINQFDSLGGISLLETTTDRRRRPQRTDIEGVNFGDPLAGFESFQTSNLDLINEKIRNNTENTNQFESAIRSLGLAYDTLSNEAIPNFANAINIGADVFSRFAEEGISSFKDLARAVLQGSLAIVKALIREGVAAAIANTLKGPSGLLGPIGLGIAAASGKAAAALFSGLIGPPPKLAKGGIAIGEQIVTVGDNPSGREAIIPLEKLPKLINEITGNRSGDLVSFLHRDHIYLAAETAKVQYQRRR